MIETSARAMPARLREGMPGFAGGFQVGVVQVADGVAQRREVRTGYRNNGQFEITAGLEPGERVVVTGQASLRSDARVQVIGE